MKNILLAMILAGASGAAAGDSGFTTSVGLGWNNLEFKLANDEDVTARYATLNLGLTGQFGTFYGNLSGELFGADNQEKFNGAEKEITSVERQDLTLTFGFLPMKGLSVFAGYTVGEMKDDFNGNFHEDKGPFIGAGYSFAIQNSSLGLTLAYANLDGEIRTDGAVPGSDPIPTASGDTTGISLGVTWSGPYRGDIGYLIGLRLRRYDFDANDAAYNGDKNVTAVTAGLTF